ncbi:hypothetical protein EG832_15540, partial [bacterium]|nr:hypothetical protein [bacterium]
MKKHWILNFIMIMMLAGCVLSSSEPTPTPDNSEEQTIAAVEIEMAKTMTEAAVTVTAPFNEDGPAKSQTPSPGDGDQCELNVLELPNSITGVEGKLILQGRDYSSKNWYLFDIASG